MRMRYLPLVSILSLAVLVGGGCLSPESVAQRAAEKVIENRMKAEGQDGSVDFEDGQITYTDNETGASGTFGAGVKLPSDFPSDVPLPKDITITGYADTTDGVWVSYTTKDGAEDLAAWYESELENGGWTTQGTFAMSGSTSVVYEKGDLNIALVITADTQNDLTMVMVTRGEK